jgi:hypothetical protein
MSVDTLLTDSCTIQYDASTTTGDSGKSATPNWQTLASAVPCKLSGSGAAEQYAERAMSVRNLTIYFSAATTIAAAHRIVLNSKTYLVLGVDTPTANGAVHFKAASVRIVE